MNGIYDLVQKEIIWEACNLTFNHEVLCPAIITDCSCPVLIRESHSCERQLDIIRTASVTMPEGIGLETVRALAYAGADVVFTCRNLDSGRQVLNSEFRSLSVSPNMPKLPWYLNLSLLQNC